MQSGRSVKVPLHFPFKRTLYYVSDLTMIVITDHISMCGARSTLANIPFQPAQANIIL